ncbi:MAG: class I SAM-dependent methyltransferase, partial [Rickettsiales bacterium]|nr:class I SAM-dependent methyltransferase [Rickettsiales bacterium]
MSQKKKIKGRLPQKRKKQQQPESQAVTNNEPKNAPLTIDATDQPWDENRKNLLFISFGANDRVLPQNFNRAQWNITFCDASRLVELSQIESEKYDLIWSVNHLVCLYAHEVPRVVKEMHRI